MKDNAVVTYEMVRRGDFGSGTLEYVLAEIRTYPDGVKFVNYVKHRNFREDEDSD